MNTRSASAVFALSVTCISLGNSLRADDIVPAPDKKKDAGIHWTGVLLQSGFFLGLEHTYRLSTEQGTRDGLHGSFFGNYSNSLGNLHGWADGDPFFVNYVGHPMQGAVTGFILVQNDPRGATLEYGNNPSYWKSRLRAAAWSWIYSEQFEIGPLSEASLGRVQSYFPQQGFVDQVITPVFGAAWMVTEDILDKYVIKRMEDKVQNPFVRMMFRGWLNPTRSMANMLRLKEPWYRDTRADIDEYRSGSSHYLAPVAFGEVVPHTLREVPPMSFTLHYAGSQGPSAAACNGAGAEAQFRITNTLSSVTDISGCKALFPNKNLSGDSLSYMTGLRFSHQLTDRWTIYGQALAGGNKVTTELLFPDIKKLTPSTGEDDWVSHSKYTQSQEANTFSTSVGGGAEYTLNDAFAFRVAGVDYVHNWNAHSDLATNDGVRFSTGIVLRLGTW